MIIESAVRIALRSAFKNKDKVINDTDFVSKSDFLFVSTV